MPPVRQSLAAYFRQSACGWLCAVLLLALVNSLSGKLALALAIPPGYATAIYPPAGIALAALLLGGYRLWPGVYLGSLLLNLWTGFEHYDALDQAVVATAGFIALGSTLQALLAAWLVRRFVDHPLALESERDILHFMLLGGPLSCLVAATVGGAALYLNGAISAAELPYSWWTWWIGDTLGVLVAAPLVLMVCSPSQGWRARRLTVALPLAITLSAAILVFVRASHAENQRIQQQFVQQAENVKAEITDQLARCASVHDFLSRFHAVVPAASRQQFETFVAPIFSHCSCLQGVAWTPSIDAQQRPQFEAAMRREGYADFQITELNATTQLVRAAPRSVYFPVGYVVPHAGNERVAGFDVLSESLRRQAAQRAAATGQATATTRLRMAHLPAADEAVLIFLPVYRQPDSLPPRQEALEGFMITALRIDILMANALRGINAKQFAVRLHEPASAPDDTLYERGWNAAAPAPGAPHWSGIFPIGQHQWQLDISATPAYLSAHRSWQGWAVLAGGLLFSGLLGMFLLTVTGQAASRTRLIDERTYALSHALKSLEENERRFRTFVNAAPVMMWMTDAAHRPVLFNDSWLAFTGRTLEQQMAQPWIASDDVHPDDRAAREALFKTHFDNHTQFVHQYRRKNKDGVYRWIEAVVVPRFDTNGTFSGYIGCCLDITERAQHATQLASALEEKELLLGEIHHRVKNNLQIIDSLLGLQSAQVTDPGALAVLRDSQNRVKSMALIHQTLYQSKNFAQVDFTNVLDILTTSLFISYGADPSRITLQLDAQDVSLSMNAAIPLGLIVNELVSNALKHAFPDHAAGTIQVELSTTPEGEIALTVSDNGIGIPPELEPESSPTLGLHLVELLASQLHGNLEIHRQNPTRFTLRFRE